jgi:von Willebrand factor type A domain
MKTLKLAFALPILSMFMGTAQAAITQDPDRVEVAFVLDTTGSMGDLIDGAKKKIWSIASTIVETNPDADVSMALVAYRDLGDDYVLQTTPLSEDIQGMYGKLVRLEAGGGGDTPESVNAALNEAVKKLQWTSGDHVKRIIFLVGDAPPHMDYQQERQYPEILKDADNSDIIVNAVQAGDMWETTAIWKEIAQFGHGRYIAIPQTGGEVTIVVTPYDDEILELQGRLDKTVVPYGNMEQQNRTSDVLAEKSAAPSSVKLDNSKYYAKRRLKKEVLTGRGDLVGDVRNNAVEFDKVAEEELPKELQSQPKAERKAWLDQKLEERAALETQMEGLITKRDNFVVEENKKSTKNTSLDSFDRAVEDTLRVQLN